MTSTDCLGWCSVTHSLILSGRAFSTYFPWQFYPSFFTLLPSAEASARLISHTISNSSGAISSVHWSSFSFLLLLSSVMLKHLSMAAFTSSYGSSNCNPAQAFLAFPCRWAIRFLTHLFWSTSYSIIICSKFSRNSLISSSW